MRDGYSLSVQPHGGAKFDPEAGVRFTQVRPGCFACSQLTQVGVFFAIESSLVGGDLRLANCHKMCQLDAFADALATGQRPVAGDLAAARDDLVRFLLGVLAQAWVGEEQAPITTVPCSRILGGVRACVVLAQYGSPPSVGERPAPAILTSDYPCASKVITV